MPSKNTVKVYSQNAYYHIYNRGVEKRNIFLDSTDCSVFLYYLKVYLSNKDELLKLAEIDKKIARFIRYNLFQEIDLLAFALMPNHFHLFVKQYSSDGITKLMKKLSTGYAMYFNRKYQRVGPLFQNIYKATLITSESHYLHLSRYIHLNPMEINSSINFQEFTSYPYYIGKKDASWVKPHEILSYFHKSLGKSILLYKDFMKVSSNKYLLNDSRAILGDLVLEDE